MLRQKGGKKLVSALGKWKEEFDSFSGQKEEGGGKRGVWKADIDDLMTTVSFFPRKILPFPPATHLDIYFSVSDREKKKRGSVSSSLFLSAPFAADRGRFQKRERERERRGNHPLLACK